MANFKGGFAFNNEAAKVEVEQAPDGTLVSCVNPVTGESLNAGNSTEIINATMANPFAGYEHEFDLFSNNAKSDYSGFIQMDLTALGGTVITMPFYARQAGQATIRALSASANQGNNPFIVDCKWNLSTLPDTHIEVYSFDVLNNGQYIDAESYASSITTVTTIYHHPMP